jgi:hypothetical protein
VARFSSFFSPPRHGCMLQEPSISACEEGDEWTKANPRMIPKIPMVWNGMNDVPVASRYACLGDDQDRDEKAREDEVAYFELIFIQVDHKSNLTS